MINNTTNSTIRYNELFRLDGQVAFISASSQGLGLSIAYALAQSGATVIINGRNEDKLQQVIQEANQKGVSLKAFCGDMSQKEEIERLMLWIEKHYGGCNILVNNLGLRLRQGWQTVAFNQMQDLVETNLLAPMYLSQLMVKQMSEGGRVISLASVAGPIARIGDAIYPITKLGVVAMTRSLAVEFAPLGICVNAIAPGAFATESNQALANDPIKGTYMSNRIPMQRWGSPDEIGGVAVFLVSQLSSYMTGQVLTVDGGLSVLF